MNKVRFEERDTLPSIKLDFTSLPNRYNVMVGKTEDGKWDWKIGHVITHLDINDWCRLHGYKLREVYPGTRPAFPSEMEKPIDLF